MTDVLGAQFDADRRDALWHVFLDKYERFTAVLCSAAKHGVTPSEERAYHDLRIWFLTNYTNHASRLRPHMNGEIHFAATDGTRSFDGFEAIFQPVTLAELLGDDDGRLIDHVTKLSQAVYAVED